MTVVGADWTQLSLKMRGRIVGEDYEYCMDPPPIRFTFSAVRETSNGLRAEVRVQSTEPGNEGDILQDHLTLISTRSKISFANAIGKRTKIALPWAEIVELVSLTTADTFRQGEPFIFLKDTVDQPQDRTFLVRYLLPFQQTAVLYGDGMAGKSLLAMTCAIAVATGQNLPGIVPSQDGQAVLYLDWETTPSTHAFYLRCIERGQGIEVARERVLYRRMARSLALESRVIKKQVDEHRVGLLVVDSMVPACGGEPESAEVVMTFFNAIRGIGPITTLVISHITKSEAERKGLPRPFGSVFTTNLARSTWLARRATVGREDELSVGLYHTKTNFGRLFQPMGIRYKFGQNDIKVAEFQMDDMPELGEHMALSQRVRGVLKRGPATAYDVADTLMANADSVRKTLRGMRDVVTVDGGNSGGRGKKKTWGLRSDQEDPMRVPPRQRLLDDGEDIPF